MGAPRDDLRLLAIFHYVLAAVTALFSVVPAIYLGLGVAILRGAFATNQGPPPPPAVGWLVVAIGVLFLGATLLFAVLLAIAGWSLGTTRNWLYDMIVAGLACAVFPFGTVLGVFTIVVLSRPEVKSLFGRPHAVPPPLAASPG